MVNKLLSNIPTGNITELNELLSAGGKLVCHKIDVPQRNSIKNSKPGWEIRLDGLVKKLWQQSKLLKEGKAQRDMLGEKDPKNNRKA